MRLTIFIQKDDILPILSVAARFKGMSFLAEKADAWGIKLSTEPSQRTIAPIPRGYKVITLNATGVENGRYLLTLHNTARSLGKF